MRWTELWEEDDSRCWKLSFTLIKVGRRFGVGVYPDGFEKRNRSNHSRCQKSSDEANRALRRRRLKMIEVELYADQGRLAMLHKSDDLLLIGGLSRMSERVGKDLKLIELTRSLQRVHRRWRDVSSESDWRRKGVCQTRFTICSREEEQDVKSANAEVTPVCDKRSVEIIRALDEELLEVWVSILMGLKRKALQTSLVVKRVRMRWTELWEEDDSRWWKLSFKLIKVGRRLCVGVYLDGFKKRSSPINSQGHQSLYEVNRAPRRRRLKMIEAELYADQDR